MSREIKFRAWIKNNNRMENCIEVNPFYIGDCDRFHWKHEEVNLMQYVGFKDKNDKEIYEGDIDQYGYVVTYLADLQGGLGMNAGWYLQRDNFESWSELECNKDIEIIGNIFETPEKAINNCNTDYSQMI